MPLIRSESDGCPAGRVCVSSSSTGDDVSAKTTPGGPPEDSSYHAHPGPHRYIGIVMVAVLATVCLTVYLYFFWWRRRTLKYGFFGPALPTTLRRRRRKDVEQQEKLGGDLLASRPTTCVSDVVTVVGEPKKSKKRSRNEEASDEDREIVKQVSGGLVFFAELPRVAAPPRRDVRHHGTPQYAHGVSGTEGM